MLSEAVVFFACVSHQGCSETQNQYQVEHPEVKQQLDRDSKQIEQAIGPTTIGTAAAIMPVATVMTGGTTNLKLFNSFYLQINRQQGMILLKKEFK